MKSTPLQRLLITGLLLLPSLTLHAAVDSFLELDVKCYTQKKSTVTPERIAGEVAVTRLNAKQLLDLLAKNSGVKYTNGSRLKVVAGAVFVADSAGKVIADVSKYFQLKVSSDTTVFNGATNLTTGERRTETYLPMTFVINLPSLKGKVNGLITEKIRVSKADRLGVQEASAVSDGNVSGQGTLGGTRAYLGGTFQLRGRQAILTQ